jgi:hypothetical protein
MKKCIGKYIAMFLTFAMVLAAAAPGEVQAAVKKQTMYIGEEIYLTNFYAVKSVSSTDKSVVSITKDKSNKLHANVRALNKGTSTVTVKTKKGTFKYKITVKNLDVTSYLTDLGNGKYLLSVKNNTAQTFETMTLECTLRDAEGNALEPKTATVKNAVSKKTVYAVISNTDESFVPDLSQSTVTVQTAERSLIAKYVNVSSRMKTTVKRKDKGTSNKMKFTVSTKNTLSGKYVSGNVYIIIRDGDGKIVNMTTPKDSFALNGGATSKKYSCTASFPEGTDTGSYTYEVKTVAYSITY